MACVAWGGAVWYYNRLLHFPPWYKPLGPMHQECRSDNQFNDRFDLSKVAIKKHVILPDNDPEYPLYAWHFKPVKGSRVQGVVLVHGAGMDLPTEVV
ncbi:MAG: hypothetical protein IT289_02705 [Oligoflexia bacterium]|nr:hypothetical protein [Oligoflexia bacterium]